MTVYDPAGKTRRPAQRTVPPTSQTWRLPPGQDNKETPIRRSAGGLPFRSESAICVSVPRPILGSDQQGMRIMSDPLPSTDQPLPTARHRGMHIFLWLLVAGVACFVFTAPWLLEEAVWDGHFPLTLDVRSASGKPLKALAYATFLKRPEAEWATKHVTGQPVDVHFHPAAPHDGRFVAEIGCSGRTWVFNIETRYTEFRYLVCRVTYADGSEVRRMAEVPAGRGSRSLNVVVP